MTLGQANYAIRQNIAANSNFLIVSHVSPDGDSVGSALMTYYMLTQEGKTVEIWFYDTPDEKYEFIPGFNQIQIVGDNPPSESFDTIFAVDTRNLSLIGFTLPTADNIINIDHRDTNTDYGDIDYVDPNACSTTEMIYRITNQLPQWGENLCTGMYVGIFADTAKFTNDLTDKYTFNIAAKAVEEGVSPSEVASELS